MKHAWNKYGISKRNIQKARFVLIPDFPHTCFIFVQYFAYFGLPMRRAWDPLRGPPGPDLAHLMAARTLQKPIAWKSMETKYVWKTCKISTDRVFCMLLPFVPYLFHIHNVYIYISMFCVLTPSCQRHRPELGAMICPLANVGRSPYHGYIH